MDIALAIRRKLGVLRRASQFAALILLAALPASGLISIDLSTQSLSVFGNRVWPHELHLVVLGLLVLMVCLGGLALAFGRLFCGWLCPQTLLCELASKSILQRTDNVIPSRNPVRRLISAAAIVSLIFAVALIILSYFIPQSALISLAQGRMNTSVLKGVVLVLFLLVVDVFFLRHAFCEWMCLFGWWQRLFISNRSLRVAFDTKRGKECTRCEQCKAVCFMGLDPRRWRLPKTCLNCGKCVTACDLELASVRQPGLIWYRFGLGAPGMTEVKRGHLSLANLRTLGFLAVALVVVAVFFLAIVSRPTLQIKIRQAEAGPVRIVDGRAKGSFVVDVYNNSGNLLLVSLEESGLPHDSVLIAPNPIAAGPRTKARVALSFDADPASLHPGRNTLAVTAVSSENGELRSSDQVVFGLPILPSRLTDAADRALP